MGWYSLHFDPVAPYVDHSTTPKSWAYKDGTHPKKFYFSNWTYNEQTRNFVGTTAFEKDYFGLGKYIYNLTFSEDFTEIFSGVRHGFDRNGKLMDSESHETGGLTAYEYIIQHDVPPYIFKLNCQVIRQRSYFEGIDNLIVYYKLDSSQQTYEPSTKVAIIRDSNETSITIK